MEVIVFVIAVGILGVAANFFGADSREFCPVQEEVTRWSR
jgi:hypothetical protein